MWWRCCRFVEKLNSVFYEFLNFLFDKETSSTLVVKFFGIFQDFKGASNLLFVPSIKTQQSVIFFQIKQFANHCGVFNSTKNPPAMRRSTYYPVPAYS